MRNTCLLNLLRQPLLDQRAILAHLCTASENPSPCDAPGKDMLVGTLSDIPPSDMCTV